MVGNMIYLLYRQNMKTHQIELIAPHATFAGAFKQLNENRQYYEERGFPVATFEDCSFLAKDRLGEPSSYFFVSTRTILE